METAIGLGNLVGGFVLGLIATRVRKGRLIIPAYTSFGALVFLLGMVSTVPLVLGILFGVGVANMAFVIPSQTLFQERTPPELMGRVVSFRFALVFGGMSRGDGLGGLFVGWYGPGPVIAVGGVISMAPASPASACAPFAMPDGRGRPDRRPGRYTVGRVRRRPQATPAERRSITG